MAVKKIFAVPLDIKRPTSSNRDFEVVEGDTGNVIVATLTDDGVAVDLSGCLVVAVFSRPDGTTVEQDANEHGVTVGGTNSNVITIDLYTGSYSPGMVNCEIQVYSGTNNETLVTSAQFNFGCRRAIINDDTVQSVDKFPILTGLIAEATEVIENTETATAAANTAANLANTKAGLADTAATNADAKAELADGKATLADQKATLADEKAAAADAAATNATAKASLAATAASAADTAAAAANAAAAQVLTNGQSDWGQTDDTKIDFVKNKPTTMPPSAHTHPLAELTGVTPAAVGAIPSAEKGAVNGVAELNVNAKVIPAQTSSAVTEIGFSYGVDDSFSGLMVTCSAANNVIYTLSADASIGVEVEFVRLGTGTVSFAAGTGATVISVDGKLSIGSQYGCSAVKKISATTWLVTGDLS